MSNFITLSEVFAITINRNIDVNILKSTQVIVAEEMYIYNVINNDFLDKVLSDTGNTYTTLINDYIKPIIAWGTIYNNFNYLITNITDKGIVYMIVEGTASLYGTKTIEETKREIHNTITILTDKLIKFSNKEKKLGKIEYELFDIVDDFSTSTMKIYSTPSTITPI